jgi:hypothetical protein
VAQSRRQQQAGVQLQHERLKGLLLKAGAAQPHDTGASDSGQQHVSTSGHSRQRKLRNGCCLVDYIV